jgi:non-specific serine/threonine protein kinase
MLETVRLYVLGKLQAAGEQGSIAGRHAAWYLDFAEHGTAHLGSPTQQEWFLRLESEQANLRAALSWAVETGHSEEGARLALALWKFWTARAYHREALRWLEQVLSLDSSAPIDTRLKARLLNALGFVAQEVKSFEQSTGYYTEALRILREQGDSGGAIVSLLNLGWKSFVAADLDAAERYAEEGLALARREDDVRSVGIALNLLSSVRIAAGRLDGVIPATEEALSISRHLGDLPEVANTLSTYAQAERMLGNLEHACALLLEGLHLQASLGTYTGLLASIVGMFLFARDTCKAPEKYIYLARLSGVFAALDEKVGGGRSPWTQLEIFPMHEQLIAELGEEGFDREATAGQDLTVESIVALGEDIVRSALALSSTTKSVATSAPASMEEPISVYPARLTSREVEVLRVVAAGLTNKQAAERLSVTPRTINAHLTSIYGKIGVTSRTGAVRFALDHDLA